MLTIQETIDKAERFTRLPKGWHFGEGGPIAEEVFDSIKTFAARASQLGFNKANIFPGIDGGAELVFYEGSKMSYAFRFHTDSKIDIEIEEAGKVIKELDGLDFSEAEHQLWSLASKKIAPPQ